MSFFGWFGKKEKTQEEKLKDAQNETEKTLKLVRKRNVEIMRLNKKLTDALEKRQSSEIDEIRKELEEEIQKENSALVKAKNTSKKID